MDDEGKWAYLAKQSDNRTVVATTAIKFGALVLLGVCAFGAVAVLAGRNTFANIGVTLLGNLKISEALAWLFGASGVGYGWRERNLRRKVNAELGGRVSKLEQQIDPDRSSSELSGDGRTNPADR